MAKVTDLVWEEADEEFYSNAKWSVSSVVVPTRPSATNADDTPSPAMPRDDEPEEGPR